MRLEDLVGLVGKTIENIATPSTITVNENYRGDDNIVITFTDGSVLSLASWDYEGYSSGIDFELTWRG